MTCHVCMLAVAIVAASQIAVAQSAVSRVVEGRVTRAAESGRPVPVAGQWVVLHRVGTDRSGALDSMRTDRAGRYRIRYSVAGEPDALYFVSARYAGIAYFSPPLRAVTTRGGDADVHVFATTTDTSILRVPGRHLVVSAPRGTRREIAEIFEIENTGFRTVVARDSATPLWSVALPERAESASVAPGDLTLAAVAFRNGRAELYAPVSPGVRQLVLTYQLPAEAFPASLHLERPVSVLEVLLEEPRAIVEGARLAEVNPATVDQRMFRRFLAQNVPATAVMRVRAPPPVEQNTSTTRMLAIGTAVILVVALIVWYAARRPRLRPTADNRRATGVDVLIAELATLDATFEKEQASAERRVAHDERRGQLRERIARALAEENSPG